MAGEFYTNLAEPEMIAEFVEAWRADDAEVDGQRTYNVHRVRQAIEQAGYPWQTVSYACTVAAKQVHEERQHAQV